MDQLNHDDKHMPPHGPHRMGMWKSSWKSPIGLGFFLLTASLALAIFLYTLLNLIGALLQATHPAPASQGLSAQELQQLESQSAPTGPAAQ